VLIDRGVAQAPVAAVRRPGYVGTARAAAGHLVIEPGAVTLDALMASIRSGFVVEDAGPARVDPVRWDVMVPIGRARRIEAGRVTGHVYGDLVLRARVPALLASVAAASAEVRAFAHRELVDGEPLWRSATAPYLSARAHLAARPRRA